MAKKPKFKPEITRIKLNPEQAVLVCDCYNSNYAWNGQTTYYVEPSSVMFTVCGTVGEKWNVNIGSCDRPSSPGDPVPGPYDNLGQQPSFSAASS